MKPSPSRGRQEASYQLIRLRAQICVWWASPAIAGLVQQVVATRKVIARRDVRVERRDQTNHDVRPPRPPEKSTRCPGRARKGCTAAAPVFGDQQRIPRTPDHAARAGIDERLATGSDDVLRVGRGLRDRRGSPSKGSQPGGFCALPTAATRASTSATRSATAVSRRTARDLPRVERAVVERLKRDHGRRERGRVDSSGGPVAYRDCGRDLVGDALQQRQPAAWQRP